MRGRASRLLCAAPPSWQARQQRHTPQVAWRRAHTSMWMHHHQAPGKAALVGNQLVCMGSSKTASTPGAACRRANCSRGSPGARASSWRVAPVGTAPPAHLEQHAVHDLQQEHVARGVDGQQRKEHAGDGGGGGRAIDTDVGTDLVLWVGGWQGQGQGRVVTGGGRWWEWQWPWQRQGQRRRKGGGEWQWQADGQ